MAGVVKWLRPRIVVPICMGSNPISRPILRAFLYGMLYLYKGVNMSRLSERISTDYYVELTLAKNIFRGF